MCVGGGVVFIFILKLYIFLYYIFNYEKIEKMCEEIETNLNLNEMV